MSADGVELEEAGGVIEVLEQGVLECCSLLGDEVVDGDNEVGIIGIACKFFDDGDGGVFSADNEGVREDGSATAADEVGDLNGGVEDDSCRDVDEDAVRQVGGVQGDVLGGAETGFILHEVLFHEIGEFLHGAGEGHDEDSLGKGGAGVDEVPVAEEEVSFAFFEVVDFYSGGEDIGEVKSPEVVELLRRTVTPFLGRSLWGREVEEALPSQGAACSKPVRPIGGDGGGGLRDVRGGAHAGKGLWGSMEEGLSDAAFHFQFDQSLEFDGVFHGEFLNEVVDESIDSE